MLLDPLHAVSSLDFYRRVAGQSGWRSTLYLAYLSLLFALVFTVSMKVNAGPHIDAAFDWLKTSAPTLTFQNGKATANPPAPATLRDPDIPQIAIVIDTARVEPVTPQTLDDAKVSGYLTGTAFYMLQRPGELRVYDFSKSSDPRAFVIDAAFYDYARKLFVRVFYPSVFAATGALFALWMAATTIIFALVGLLLNALAEGGVCFAPLVSIALYAQTFVVGLLAVALFLPFAVPGWRLIWLASTGGYIWLAIKRLGRPPAAPAAPAA